MVRQLFYALIQAGIPMAVTSYLLTWWALKHQYFPVVASLKDLEGQVKKMSKARSRNRKAQKKRRKEAGSDVTPEPGQPENRKMNPVYNKWLSFGGGFYGVAALITYVVVELGEIGDFIMQFDGFLSLISNITPALFIGLFIESLKNFIVAIAWPAYWLDAIRSDYIWLWFIAAFAGYRVGTGFALQKAKKSTSG